MNNVREVVCISLRPGFPLGILIHSQGTSCTPKVHSLLLTVGPGRALSINMVSCETSLRLCVCVDIRKVPARKQFVGLRCASVSWCGVAARASVCERVFCCRVFLITVLNTLAETHTAELRAVGGGETREDPIARVPVVSERARQRALGRARNGRTLCGFDASTAEEQGRRRTKKRRRGR